MYHWRVVAWKGCGSNTSTTRVFTTANPVDIFYDAMESGGSRWTAETVLGTARWILSDRRAHSPSHAWYMPSAAVPTDARLTLAGPITVDGITTLAFWHRYDMETAWDGGVLEISANGGAWQDLGDRITAGGYNYTLSSVQDNPLGGRRAWSGNSDGWREVLVDLSTYAGSSVRIRFRWGGDRDNAREPDGWFVDDVRFAQIWPPSKYKAFVPLSFRGG
jgi:hypothetical protein